MMTICHQCWQQLGQIESRGLKNAASRHPQLNDRINQRPYQGTPFGVTCSTTNRYGDSEAVECQHGVPWGCWLWLPASHVLGQHTCTEHPLWARRGAKVTTAGVPRRGSRAFPRSLQGARGASHTSLVRRNWGLADTSKSKPESCNLRTVHHHRIWGGGGGWARGQPQPESRGPRTSFNPSSKLSREAKLTGGHGCCHHGETLIPAEDRLLTNPLPKDSNPLVPSSSQPNPAVLRPLRSSRLLQSPAKSWLGGRGRAGSRRGVAAEVPALLKLGWEFRPQLRKSGCLKAGARGGGKVLLCSHWWVREPITKGLASRLGGFTGVRDAKGRGLGLWRGWAGFVRGPPPLPVPAGSPLGPSRPALSIPKSQLSVTAHRIPHFPHRTLTLRF